MCLSAGSEQHAYAAAILCGGKSIRMGQDKAVMRLHDIRFVDRLAREFAPCGEILISVRNRQQAAELAGGLPAGNCRFVTDETAEAGPVAGIVASLKNCRSEWLFVTAVDMPFMDKAFADELWKQAELYSGFREAEGFDAVVPLDGEGRPQVLSAFYSRSALPEIESCLRDGKRRVRSCLERLQICTVSWQNLTNAENKLININDLTEWQRVLKKC